MNIFINIRFNNAIVDIAKFIQVEAIQYDTKEINFHHQSI